MHPQASVYAHELFATRFPFAFFFGVSVMVSPEHKVNYTRLIQSARGLTRWERLLKLLSLVRVLQDQCVQVSLASDLELDLVLCVLLDACSYITLVYCSRGRWRLRCRSVLCRDGSSCSVGTYMKHPFVCRSR